MEAKSRWIINENIPTAGLLDLMGMPVNVLMSLMIASSIAVNGNIKSIPLKTARPMAAPQMVQRR